MDNSSQFTDREKKEELEFTNQEGTEEIAIDDGNNQEKKEELEFTNQEGKEEIDIDYDNNQENKEVESDFALVDVPVNSTCVSDSDDLALQAALLHSVSKDPHKEAVLNVKKRGISPKNSSPSKRICSGFGGEELGEPSLSDYSECVICNDAKPVGYMVRSDCGHYFCEDCIKNYVGEKLKEDIFSVKCPEKNCKKLLMNRIWRRYVPEEVFDRWERAYAESRALANPRTFLCPVCLGQFADDRRGFKIRACTNCWRLLCTRCWDPWHVDFNCEEY